MKYLFLILLTFSVSYASNFFYEFGKKVEMAPSVSPKSTNETYDDVQEYITSDGKYIKFRNEIIVQCVKDAYCEDDFEELTLTNYKSIGSNTFLITLDSTQNIFTFCQNLYEKEDIETAHPNYIRKLIRK